MAEKEKTYPSHSITIESEEYRDLIIENEKNRHDADDYRSKYWAEQNEKKNAQADLAKLKADYDKLSAFVTSSTEISALFKAYMAEDALNAAGGVGSVLRK